MKIQELEQKTGLDRATIRYYEREGLISPRRGENGYRDYTEEESDRLLKIRLLRQLGMSLWQIGQLQEGAEDLSRILAHQIETLNTQIRESRRAHAVCRRIQSAGVSYQELNAAYYLELLEKPLEEELEQKISRPFREPLPEEIHPWRRFFARTLDIASLYGVVNFILVVILRVRPAPTGILSTLLWMACMALMIPLEALLLSRWGTTPGKWLMGIHLESLEDRYLSWEEALERSKTVFIKGVACGIPIVELFFMERAYCKLTGRSQWRYVRYSDVNYPEDMSWDYGVETTYSDTKRKWAAALLAVLFVLANVSAVDSIKPKYRGNELTVQQFARNYNSTMMVMDSELDRLNDDGSVKVVETGGVTIYMSGAPEKEHPGFAYETEAGILTGLTFENSWSDVTFICPVIDQPFHAAVSLLLARKDIGIAEIRELEKLWNEHIGQKEADFTYGGIRFRWEIELVNCEMTPYGVSGIEASEPRTVKVRLRIEL